MLLARGPRVRLEAELIRDSALQASGLLSPKIGGPSVFPPQPPSVTTEGTYGALDVEAERRARTATAAGCTRSPSGPPRSRMFGTFDGPSGEACVARREVSNTPLQALTLLNDAVVPRGGAGARPDDRRRRPATDRGRDDRDLFRRCPDPAADRRRVAALLVSFYEPQQRALGDGRPGRGRSSWPATATATSIERAAWTATARAVLNLDEVVTKN